MSTRAVYLVRIVVTLDDSREDDKLPTNKEIENAIEVVVSDVAQGNNSVSARSERVDK